MPHSPLDWVVDPARPAQVRLESGERAVAVVDGIETSNRVTHVGTIALR